MRKVRDSVIDPEALHFTSGKWGECPNGQTFQQDAVTSFGGWLYATYDDSARRLCVARQKQGALTWEVIRFSDYHFKGNDTHNVAVLGIAPVDGTIHLCFDHHSSPLHYRVSKSGAATTPEATAWTEALFSPITNQLASGKPLTRVTYPRFLRTPQGGLQLGLRIGGSGNGDKCLTDYDPKTQQWRDFGVYIDSKGTYDTSPTRNPYLNGLTYDTKGRLHVSWCWRESSDPMTNHDLLYAWSDDQGKTWHNGAGTRSAERGKLPLTLSTPGTRGVELGVNRGLINTTTQAVDSQQRLHVATFHLPDRIPPQPDWETCRQKSHYFHYWRDTSGTWQRNEIPLIGSRPQLWFDPQDDAYLVFVGDRYHPSPYLTLATATAKNRWADWKVLHQEKGPFTGQPQLDRYAAPGTMAVYIQEAPTPKKPTASPLRLLTFQSASGNRR